MSSIEKIIALLDFSANIGSKVELQAEDIPVLLEALKPVSNLTGDIENTAALVEQINGLLDKYDVFYGLCLKTKFTPDANIHKSVERVLENIEKTIAALCLRVTASEFVFAEVKE